MKAVEFCVINTWQICVHRIIPVVLLSTILITCNYRYLTNHSVVLVASFEFITASRGLIIRWTSFLQRSAGYLLPLYMTGHFQQLSAWRLFSPAVLVLNCCLNYGPRTLIFLPVLTLVIKSNIDYMLSSNDNTVLEILTYFNFFIFRSKHVSPGSK